MFPLGKAYGSGPLAVRLNLQAPEPNRAIHALRLDYQTFRDAGQTDGPTTHFTGQSHALMLSKNKFWRTKMRLLFLVVLLHLLW